MPYFKTFTIALAAIMVLGGCTTSYRETLDQKLEGKSQAEKRAILAQECGAEIGKGLKKENPGNVSYFKKMKQICEEMTGQKVNTDSTTQ